MQYREALSEEVLGSGYEKEMPEIGRRVLIGRERYEVLYRWRGGPMGGVVYVRPVSSAEGWREERYERRVAS